jgi:hypothetical protein
VSPDRREPADQPDRPGRPDRHERQPRPDDAFPSTNDAWIRGELAAGDDRRRALRSVIMGRYFEPLRIYVKGSSYRHLGESAELVSALFRQPLRARRLLGRLGRQRHDAAAVAHQRLDPEHARGDPPPPARGKARAAG